MDRRYLINARKTPRNPPLSIQMNNYFSVIRSFLLFIPCRANAHTRELFLSLESLFFRASVYLFSFSFLSFSLFLFFFFISRWNLDERTLLCKAIFNPFWRPFSPSFFESFVPHYPAASRPHPTYFDFTASPLLLHSTLSRTLCLFLSWQSPLIQSRLNYAGFSSGDSARKGGGEKNKIKTGVARIPSRWHRTLKKEKGRTPSWDFFSTIS